MTPCVGGPLNKRKINSESFIYKHYTRLRLYVYMKFDNGKSAIHLRKRIYIPCYYLIRTITIKDNNADRDL